MRIPSYLTLSRHNIYYFRFPLVKSKTKTDYLYLSLKTRQPKEALRLSRGLEYYASEISRCYRDALMNDHEVKKLVGDFLKSKLKEQWLLIDKKPYYKDKEAEWSNALKTIEADPIPYTHSIIKKMELNIEEDSNDFQMLHEYIHRNLSEYHASLKGYNDQAFKIDLKPEQVRQIKEVSAIYAIEDVIPKFFEASRTEKDWGKKRQGEMARFIDILKQILGSDFNTMSMTKEAARAVVDVVYNIPTNKEKNPLTRGLGVLEAIKIEGVDKISTGTITKYLTAFSIFFDWCVDSGYSEINPFNNLKGNIKNKSQEVRLAFSEEQIDLILNDVHNYPNGLVKKEYQYWGTIIGLYTGARLNEISQLEIDDVRSVDGIYYFDINDDGDKNLKTKSSKRKIPIHKKLIEHGIIDYINKLKADGKKRILCPAPL